MPEETTPAHPFGLPSLGPDYRVMWSTGTVEETGISGRKATYLKPSGELQSILAEHQKWLDAGKPESPIPGQGQRAQLIKTDLRNVSLRGVVLHGANFWRAQLQGANLGEAQLHEAGLVEAQLHGADLRQAQLHGADLWLAQLHGADLRQAQLHGAHLSSAQLQGADLRQAQLHGADLAQAQLQGANLGDAQLQGANLAEVQFHGAYLDGVQFHGAYLWLAQLHGADLGEAQLHGANLAEAQLHGANLQLAQLHGADLRQAQLHGADLWEAQLHGADLRQAQLHGTDLWKAQLHGADLRQAQLQPIQARVGVWNKPRKSLETHYDSFPACNLAGAMLPGTNLERADLGEVNLSEASWEWSKEAADVLAKVQASFASGVEIEKLPKEAQERLQEARVRLDAIRPGARIHFKETRLVDANLRKQDFQTGWRPAWARRVPFLGELLAFLIPGRAVYLDDCLIQQARFDHEVQEPWHMLRRHYSGVQYFLILLAVAATLAPNFLKALAFKTFQESRQQVEPISQSNPGAQAPPELIQNAQKFEQWMAANAQEGYVGWYALGLGGIDLLQPSTWLNHPAQVFSLILLAYVIVRGVITSWVVKMFRNEQSSGYTPRAGEGWNLLNPESAWHGYKVLFVFHRLVMRPFLVISLVALIGNVADLCFTRVDFPPMEPGTWRDLGGKLYEAGKGFLPGSS